MSIIHDALKKVQQSPGYVYSTPAPAAQNNQLPIEHLPPVPNKTKSVLALLCAIAITLGALIFLYSQVNKYFPVPSAKITVDPPKPTPISTNAPKPSPALLAPTQPPVPISLPAISNIAPPNVPVTLNIHGVMSNGPSNVALINNHVYQEGDDVDGVKIVKINLNFITVMNNGKEERIRVNN